jgi:ATP-binding cassette subfamily F protein uup
VSHDRDFLDRTASSVLVSEGEGVWIEYAGGYTDMVNQRGQGVQARVVAKEEKPKAAARAQAAPPPPSRRKMNFNEQHDLKTLPARMAEIEAKIGKLQAILDDPQLYGRDPERFQKASSALGALQSELAAAEDRWLELEMLKDEIEG